MATAAHTRPPFWRDVRVLRVAGQVVFVILVVVVAREMFLNLEFGVRRQGIDLSFDFLEQRAGFEIKEGIDYSPNQSFLRAFRVGVVNTIAVASVGIILATVLGLVIGVARLSPNWLLRRMAQAFVELIRNVPVLVQIIFWYVAVVLALPVIGGGLSVWGVAYLSNRGAAIPWVRAEPGAGAFGLVVLVGLAAAAAAWRWRLRVHERTGAPPRRFPVAAAVLGAIVVAGYAATGGPLSIEVPQVDRFGYEGGFQASPEYTALLLGLVIYTAAFIAEIIRGSIQAVPKGQREAAEALGLTPGQQLRLVVLPQALRIAIPPLNSQYLNLTKNSSLGVAIGFPEIISVSGTIINQAGRATQMLLLVMATYLTLSLLISAAMNGLNRLVASRGALR